MPCSEERERKGERKGDREKEREKERERRGEREKRREKTTQSKIANSVTRSLLIRSLIRGGIDENGRLYAAWKCQKQQSGWTSLNSHRNSFSDLSVMSSIAKVQKPGFHDGISTANWCWIISESPKVEATTGFGLDRRNPCTSKSRFCVRRDVKGNSFRHSCFF